VTRAKGLVSPAEESELYEMPVTLQFHLDAEGNGYLSSSSSITQAKAFVLQNYRYQPEKKALTFSGLTPIVIWQSPGMGEILFSEQHPIKQFDTDGPSSKPLGWTRAKLKDFQLDSPTTTRDKTQIGQQLLASAQLDSQGNGAVSGVIKPYLQQETLHPYPLAYVSIQNFQLQNNLISLAEPIQSKQTPMAWFHTQAGLLLYQTEQAIWKLKAIKQEIIQSPEIDLGQSLTPPLAHLDQQGNGVIALQTSAYQWSLHRIEKYNWINSQKLEVKHRFDRKHQMVVFADKGVILSHNHMNWPSPSPDVELELSYFELAQKRGDQEVQKDAQVKRSQFLRFPLNGRFPRGLTVHLTPQGQGLLAIGSSAKGAAEGKIHLFPIKDFGL
ncbi:MAG: hypothetical protein AB7I41_25420, partial [Candidatus Sericytochromatia bacterium]